jgi:hypothetical protein
MKNFKILTILILLMGFGTTYAQQAGAELQTKDQTTETGQADRYALSPNQAPGEQTLEKETMAETRTVPSETDKMESPNKPLDPALPLQPTLIQPVTKNTEYEGPSPNDPDGRRPDTK